MHDISIGLFSPAYPNPRGGWRGGISLNACSGGILSTILKMCQPSRSNALMIVGMVELIKKRFDVL